MDIAILILLILFNGLFAMSEIALVAAKPNRLRQWADEGDAAARVALSLGGNPTRFLSTIQIGITAIGLLSGIFGEAALAVPLADKLQALGISRGASSALATALTVVGITYVAIIAGELVPKRLALLNAEAIARRMARPVSWLARLSLPFVWLLSASTEGVLRLLGKKDVKGPSLTEEDIQAMLAEGALAGVIEEQEHALVRNVFRLDDRQIASLMTPRGEITYLDVDDPADVSLRRVVASGKSRFPVCRGGLHAILGVITAKRLLKQCLNNEPLSLEEPLHPFVAVPETLTGMKLLEQFKESGVQLVFVIDEYGEVVGLITLKDVLEALAGEFRPRDPSEGWAVLREDGSWLLDGLIPVPELKDRLGFRSVPEEGDYHTLGGMIMRLTGNVPRPGDKTSWEGWTLEVLDLDGRRIDKVLAIPPQPSPPLAD